MIMLLTTVLATLASMLRTRAALELEKLALRHQIGVLRRAVRGRPTLTSADRLLWVRLSPGSGASDTQPRRSSSQRQASRGTAQDFVSSGLGRSGAVREDRPSRGTFGTSSVG